MALTTRIGSVAAADNPAFVSRPIFEPSITVSAPPRLEFQAAITTTTGLVIIPIFDASITSDSNGATIMNTINAAITFYEAHITDPVTVSIRFKKMKGGLGLNETSIACAPCASTCACGSISYSSYLAALTAHASSADDSTALAHLAGGPNNPVNGNADMWATLPNLRALGFTANPATGHADSTISLNTAICNLDRSSIDPSKYDLLAVVSHEIDEVLGLGSALNGVANGAPTPIGAVFGMDLFRYDQVGTRSLTTALAAQAFFSLDSTIQLVRFNQTAGGDFGDWFSTGAHTPRVQDAFATPGATPDLGVELTALDVIGYTFGSPTPPTQDDDTGFVPPDANTLACATRVAKNVRTLEICTETCDVKAAAAAFNGKSFDEKACETTNPMKSCRAKYDAKQAKLLATGTCPGCLDAAQQASLADQAASDLAAGNGGFYCAGAAGFVPPDANTLACETRVAKNVRSLKICIETCHMKAAAKAFIGKPFDEEGCQSADPRNSCRAKYNAAQTKLLAGGTCPSCLDAAHQGSLADQTESNLDADNGTLYCAGTIPLPPPW